jgi:hypothetical protein
VKPKGIRRPALGLILLLISTSCAASGSETQPRSNVVRPTRSSRLIADPEAVRGALRKIEPGWSKLAEPPFVRARAASVWTDQGLFYFGGDTAYAGTHHADAAIYDPAIDRWRETSKAPLSGRSLAGAVWTGSEVLVWGGADSWPDAFEDGAAYHPASDHWRLLPDSPLSARVPLVTVWTGTEMIVWGSADREDDDAILEGAAYNPSTDNWRVLPSAPIAINSGEGAWTGEKLIVVGSKLNNSNHSDTKNVIGAAYPSINQWRELPSVNLSPQASSVAWTGREVIAWDYEHGSAAYQPRSDSWRTLVDAPMRFYECYPRSAALSGLFFALYCGQSSLYDPQYNSWHAIRNTPDNIYGQPVAAGSAFLMAGAAHEGGRNALWVYKPAR